MFSRPVSSGATALRTLFTRCLSTAPCTLHNNMRRLSHSFNSLTLRSFHTSFTSYNTNSKPTPPLPKPRTPLPSVPKPTAAAAPRATETQPRAVNAEQIPTVTPIDPVNPQFPGMPATYQPNSSIVDPPTAAPLSNTPRLATPTTQPKSLLPDAPVKGLIIYQYTNSARFRMYAFWGSVQWGFWLALFGYSFVDSEVAPW